MLQTLFLRFNGGVDMEIVVFVTAKDAEEAGRIAERLVADKLCACVNILGGVKSFFWWENKVDRADEVLLIIKTRKSLFKKLERAVKRAHSYEVPEIIALPIIAGSKSYLEWVRKSTKSR